MPKKLKTKFIIGTAAALTVILMLIVGAINIFNYQSVISDANDILTIIIENSGRFPSKPETELPDVDITITPESPFESRYFSVVFDGDKLFSVDTTSIAAINNEQAVKIAKQVLLGDKERGFYHNYRFMIGDSDGKTAVVFLDCTKLLDSANTFLLLSIVVSMFSIFAVFILLWVISDKIVNPMADAYDKQKTFITNAGHDIKTPITIIDADAELLEMEIGDNEWLKDIKKQSARLAKLTSELIYLSRMEEQERALHTVFPLSDTIDEVVSSFSGPAKTKGISISTRIPPAVYYKGDESDIRKLLNILLDNAIKYSPEGGTVKLVMKKQGFGVAIKISNSATNITGATIKRMFDRFYRSDEARDSGGGFGIGLSVASAIAAAHKGRISAEKQGERLVIEVILY